ncbi:MAG: hypothetical protein IJX93_00430 [Clostridia bacterium]|nr:hypothetical protein [Clostridia bacterium]MBQ8332223.1 hypothetical protein [Clostridia bacterium]MBQ8511221.1 hypothetical protein [Clostridia bacterium]
MKRKSAFALVLCMALILSSCRFPGEEETAETEPVPEEIFYTEEDLARDLGISVDFPEADGEGVIVPETESRETEPETDKPETDAPVTEESEEIFRMKVYESMQIYASMTSSKPEKVLSDGEIVMLREITGTQWAEVYYSSGQLMGYAKDGFMHTVQDDGTVYAELPIEYGMAKTNQETLVPAYSHLVDIRKYFNVYSSTNSLEGAADFSQYDVIVSMKLSTDETTIGEPFYNKNICMVQYDILPMLKKAMDMFREDGYIMVIYDAYRPTSVQQRWFDVVRVHKWVADPSIGMGGVHDRGTAVDISLVDFNGKELEFPTPMHTFTEASARNSTTMTQTARANMDYMLGVMLECGFTYINSEWWHFQDVNTKFYLPTDHPIDTIPLVPSESTQVGTVTYQ